MSQPSVSIIVPVYNVEEYLAECLESIAAQTIFSELEIILVDDGSTDSSGQMARQFAESHDNVRLLVQENAGLGAARNAAMDLATGKYVMFCDSDDILTPHAAEALLVAVNREPGVTLAVGMMETFPNRTNWAWRKSFNYKGRRTVVDGIAAVPDLVHSASACNKIFELETVRRLGLRFKENAHFEDVWFVIPFMMQAPRIALTKARVYNYRKRESGSIMNSLFTRPENYWDHLAANLALVDLRKELDVLKHDALDQFVIRTFQGFAMRAFRMFEEEDLRLMFEQVKRLVRDVSVANIMAATLSVPLRVPYVACLMDDFELFAHPDKVLRGVRAKGDRLQLNYPTPSAFQPLLATGFSARIEQFKPSKDGRSVEVGGRFEIAGLRLAEPLDVELTLDLPGCDLRVPAQNVLRGDLQENDGDNAWAGFKAVIPADKLKTGRQVVRMSVHTDSGTVSRDCISTVGYLRSARTIQLKNARVLPDWGRGDRVELQVAVGSEAQQRRAWAKMLVRRDLGQAVHRRPFWKQRLARLATKPLMQGKDIWLIGERTDTVQDNSGHLFRYLRNNEPKRRVYYVIDKSSPDAARLRGVGHVVNHSSMRHKLLMLHASKLINSYDIDAYMLPKGWERSEYLKHLNWRIGARRVFLQHGVIDQDFSRGIHRSKTGLDLMVTTTSDEYEYVAEWMDYQDTVQQLGLPRFDALVPDHGHRRLLIMTTWRNYLGTPSYGKSAVDTVPFEGSNFEAFLKGLLGSEQLRAALDKHDFTLEFLPHYEMRQYADQLVPDHPRFEIVDLEKKSFQEALRGCDLFVTDWSSTAFDVAYMGTPMVYAQFDADEFWGTHARPGYFDYRTHGFGPVCETVEDTVEAIIRYLDNGCVREEEYEKRAQACFDLPHGGNNERVARAIKELENPIESPAKRPRPKK